MTNSDKRVPGLDDTDSVVAMRRRHLSIGLRMQALACIALEELEAKVAAGQPLGLSAEDAKALLDAGAELERAALGGKEPDDGEAPIPKAKKPN
jgi:hypothetical protein